MTSFQDFAVDLSPNSAMGDLGEALGEYTLDVDEYVKYYVDFYRAARCGLNFSVYFIPFYIFTEPCLRNYDVINARDRAVNEKLFVTSKFVVRVLGKHSRGCRCACFDVGRSEKVIPLNAILQVNVTEPAGTACCCFVKKRLYIVDIETAASASRAGRQAVPELRIEGLPRDDAYSLRKAILDAKDALNDGNPATGTS